MNPIVLGFDPSWSGLGWCIATKDGPLITGHSKNLGSSWRWAKLHKTLGAIDEEFAEQIRLHRHLTPIVVTETPPKVYSRRKNQAVIAGSLGQITGAITFWGTRPGSFAYPWQVEPKDWRSWWGIRTGGTKRMALKLHAVRLVRGRGWAPFISPWEWTGKDGGAQADVAEAVLIAVGAATQINDVPKGPKRDKSWR